MKEIPVCICHVGLVYTHAYVNQHKYDEIGLFNSQTTLVTVKNTHLYHMNELTVVIVYVNRFSLFILPYLCLDKKQSTDVFFQSAEDLYETYFVVYQQWRPAQRLPIFTGLMLVIFVLYILFRPLQLYLLEHGIISTFATFVVLHNVICFIWQLWFVDNYVLLHDENITNFSLAYGSYHYWWWWWGGGGGCSKHFPKLTKKAPSYFRLTLKIYTTFSIFKLSWLYPLPPPICLCNFWTCLLRKFAVRSEKHNHRFMQHGSSMRTRIARLRNCYYVT